MNLKSIKLAAVAAVLLAFCLVFMAPVGAEETGGPDMTGTVIEVNAANAQDVLDGKYGDITGKTIKFTQDIETVLDLARPTKYDGSGTKTTKDPDINSNRYSRTLDSVTFTATEGVTLAGFIFTAEHVDGTTDNQKYDYVKEQIVTSTNDGYVRNSSLKNINFEGLTITGRFHAELYCEGASVKDITFEGCTFTGTTDDDANAAIKFLADTQYFTNIVVTDCSIDGCRQGVYISGVDGATITGNTIKNTGHNAIALQSDKGGNPAKGNVVVNNNYIEGAKDRAIRMNYVDSSAEIKINNNVMVSSGDSDGELIAPVSVATGAKIDLEYNYWCGKDVSTAVASSLTAPTNVGINGGIWSTDVSSYVAEGYKAVAKGDGTYTVSELIVAKIGNDEFNSLQTAVDAAQSDDTIVLVDDVTLTETLTIPAGKTVTLDLSGKTISQTKECTASYNMIGNLGSLTIVDTVGKGKLSFTDSGKGDSSFGWGSYTIHNSGTLIIGDEGKKAVDFTIEHIGSQTSHCANAIFQYSGSTTIYGGKISTPNYRSVRLWMGKLTIYDGTFTGNVWVHNGGTWDTNTVNIYGGTFSPGTKGGDSVYSLLIENTMNQITLNIDGGTFTSDIHVYDETKITASISGGTFTNDVSAYVKEDYICVQEAESEFVVQKKSENTVVPDVPVDSETVTDSTTGKTTTIITPESGTNVEKSTNDEGEVVVTITPTTTDDPSAVTITITGDGVKKDDSTNKVTVPESASITATYKEAEAETDEDTTSTEPQVTFQLSVDIKDITQALPVIDAKMIDEEKKEAVKENSGKEIKSFLASFTALGDNDENGVNGNLKNDDGKHAVTFVVKVHKSLVSNPHLMAALHIDGDGKPKTGSKPTLTWKEEGEFYVVTITGPNFSSYVLVEEKPQDNLGGGGSGKDTGSGNYQYYPRDVPTSGIIDFGTSKVVTGMELPAGSSGKVTLNTKPTFAMPENGFYAFEIDAPGYNLEAKINGGLSFKIPVADLEAAGWTAKDIVLYHGTVAEDGKITWDALPTNLVKNENGIAYYKAAINGCSPFYIGFVKDGSVVNTEVVDPVTPPTETPDVPGTELPEIPDVQDEPEEPSSPAPLAAVIAALGAAVVLRRK